MFFHHFAHLTEPCQAAIAAEATRKPFFAVYLEVDLSTEGQIQYIPAFAPNRGCARALENAGGFDLVIGIPEPINQPAPRIGIASGRI